VTTALPGTDPAPSAVPDGAAATRAEPTAAGILRRAAATFVESKLALAGLAILVAIAGLCFIGPLFYHSDTLATRLYQTNLPPGAGHPLGTDDSGRDILGRLMLGGQSSLEIGIAVALIATTFGAVWGALAGYIGGLLDSAMMRFVDAMLALPGIFLFLYLASIFQPNLLLIIVVLSVFSWLVPGRLVRGEVLSLRTRDYVKAVRCRILNIGGFPRCCGGALLRSSEDLGAAGTSSARRLNVGIRWLRAPGPDRRGPGGVQRDRGTGNSSASGPAGP